MGISMLKYFIILILIIIIAQSGFMLSKKIHKAKRMASKILDAYLPYDELMAHASQIASNLNTIPSTDALKGIEEMIESNYDYITSVYRELIEKMNHDAKLPPAAEWILDNYYIVERHIKEIKMGMDKKTLSKLPVVEDGRSKGYPRIFVIAEELAAHREAHIEEETLVAFVKSYQQVDILSSLELWALPLMIKVVLIENIAYICRKIRLSVKEYEYAQKYSEYITSRLDDSKWVTEKINRYFSHNSHINKTFVVQLISNLKAYGAKAILPLSLIDANLERRGLTASQIIDKEYNKQAARQIAMGNSIMGIVTLSAIDWAEVFEQLSETELLLRGDPSGTYPMMDAQSREMYRKSVKNIAAKAGVNERAVVSKAFDLAGAHSDENYHERHVGYYLIGEGKAELEQQVSGVKKKTGWLCKNKVFAYISGVSLLSFILAAAIFFICLPVSVWVAAVIGVICLIPASEIAVKLINRRACAQKKVQLLPKLELQDGIGKENATFVITPTLLFDQKNVSSLIDNLESFYLANRDDNLFFGIVGDFKDGDKPENEGEAEIIRHAVSQIHELNDKYPGERDRFYLFCRRRSFNQNEQKWMGRERKRGAICDFVHLLKTGDKGDFSTITGDIAALGPVKYIITLDADTKLHQGGALQLIGAMAHPLNRPKTDAAKGMVVQGYGIMQPRVDVDIESANKTLFSKIFAGQGGIDQYSSAVSDVYQDLFGEGIFTGKGIFDVDTFYATLMDALPDNAILSHDLLEGSYLRCALLTDVEVSDGYPAKYLSHMSRLHRWVRGDWQLLPRLFGKVKTRAGGKVKNPLNTLSKWKIIDNLRRSLAYPLLFAAIIASVLLPSPQQWWVLALAVVSVGYPLISAIIGALGSGYFNFMNQKYNATIIYGVKGALLEFLITFICLPYQAYLMADAIVRTLWRLCVSHKNMLEWVTAADAERRSKDGLFPHYAKMWISPFISALLIGIGIMTDGSGLFLSVVLAVLWALAPLSAWWISLPGQEQKYQFSEKEAEQLKLLSRQTWRYFEDFATAADNYLPPDNFQESPPNGIAHRTSPTNIGMLLISCLAARDFGYITTKSMLERIEKTLDTIDKLGKWNGHLLNWYNTKTLDVMPPAYVSTVDSGNYIAYLMTLREGLRNLIGRPSIDLSNVHGLIDTIRAAKLERPEINITDGALLSLVKEDTFTNDAFKEAIDELLGSDFSQGGSWLGKIEAMAQAIRTELSLDPDAEAAARQDQLRKIIERLTKIIDQVNFLPLFDKKRQLFFIGYNVAEEKLTRSYYDLLASEARQTSFIAIAKGEISYKHWFKLGRSLAGDDGYRGLVSWTGTMFEYLMPLLIMKSYKNTLLDETYWFAVREQIKYGRRSGKVWGTSESGFFAFDLNLNYQYKAFGVPILGLKHGLNSDVTVAPYACVMALMVHPAAAIDNIKRLQKLGMQGIYGLYEAVDFTKRRLSGDEDYAIVKSYMVHHQGMSFLALDNVLNQNIMQKRFAQDPSVRSVEYLLCERVPTRAIFTNATKYEAQLPNANKYNVHYCIRAIKNPVEYLPAAHILSNRSYSVIVTDRGGGYSVCNGTNVTRWRSDLLSQHYGNFVYVSQDGTNSWWSSTMNPTNIPNDTYRVLFTCDKAEFFRSDGQIDTHTEIAVSAEDNAEIRRVTITNHSRHEKNITLTSYCEVVLTDHDSDEAHPAFSNLFVRTEFDEKYGALIANRRSRNNSADTLWAFHCLSVDGQLTSPISYETDRARFIGRNNTAANPVAMRPGQPLENSVGAVLDPVFSIRCRVKVPVGGTVSVSFTTGMAHNRDEAALMCSKYSNVIGSDTAFEMAQTRMRLENKYFALKEGEEEEILGLLPHILYSSPLKEKYADIYARNRLPKSALWAQGISGDLPILLLRIANTDNISMVDRMLKAHEYFSLKGLACDLVILCNQEASYTRHLFDAVQERVSISYARYMQNQNGGVFVRNTYAMCKEEAELLVKAARVVVEAGDVRLAGHVEVPRYASACNVVRLASQHNAYEPSIPAVEFFNGYGGFDAVTGDYVIVLKDFQSTPLPWCNVLANKAFGCIVTESGGGYSWQCNSRENKLTPWSNDPVSDTVGEACYLKDTDSKEIFTITPKPLRTSGTYVVRHSMGYTEYRHNAIGIEAVQTVFVPPDEPVKIIMIKLKNTTDRRRNFSATYVCRPILGATPDFNRFVKTSYDGDVLYMENTYNAEFPDTAFLSCSEPQSSITADARKFVSETGGIPIALHDDSLDGKTGAGFDCVCAMQAVYSIEPGSEKTVVFVLGQCHSKEEIVKLTQKYTGTVAAEYSLDRTRSFWNELTGSIQVKTPDASMNFMVNKWLLYQTVVCRMFARSGFYQAGGAYGFRDQLQDSLSLLHMRPQLTKEQILLHAAHQFKEGDVQHWWHEVKVSQDGADRGIRSKCSDDLLWLVYTVCAYIEATGDSAILSEQIPYLESELLDEETDERYEVPKVSQESGSLYDHCVRAVRKSMHTGEHGLLLMGSGDWNDGMNTVGNKGKGESVWLSWFAYDIFNQFIPICTQQGDEQFAQDLQAFAKALAGSLEASAWGGNWYRRAYFDDGTPLGSVDNGECSIDAIAQAWSVISGAADNAKAKTAMEALERYLVKREYGLIMLLTPPFDSGELQPGYIKGYVPGVRENGGQYTHATAWIVMAFARLGDGNKAWEYFNMLNPVNHARTPIEIMQYKAEPYVVCADVYANPQHMGRGGWSWYTGSSGWFYKVATEEILGLKRRADKLFVEPCIPNSWKEFEVWYRFGSAHYHITVKNDEDMCKGKSIYTSSDTDITGNCIALCDDGKKHHIEVKISNKSEVLTGTGQL